MAGIKYSLISLPTKTRTILKVFEWVMCKPILVFKFKLNNRPYMQVLIVEKSGECLVLISYD